MSRRAILFLQLGGPETLDDVPAFLYRLFSDPDVIRVRPAPLRKAIAAAIAAGRAGASRKLYAAIGGGSPIRRLTEQQAVGTERKNEAAAAFLRTFVEEAKASGLVARLIERHKVVGLSVAPPD